MLLYAAYEISCFPILPQPVGLNAPGPGERRPLGPEPRFLLCTPRLVALGRPSMHKKTPYKMLTMAPIYDFPRAARAEHGHGDKKPLPGPIFSGRTPKTPFASAGRTKFVAGSPFPLSEHSTKPFLLLFERVASLR